MTYRVEGPVVLGEVRISVVTKTHLGGTTVRGVPVFSASKTPVWVIVRSGPVVQALDMFGATVDAAAIEAAAPGAMGNE